MYRKRTKVSKKFTERMATARAAKERKRLDGPPPEYPPDLPMIRRRVIIEDYDHGPWCGMLRAPTFERNRFELDILGTHNKHIALDSGCCWSVERHKHGSTDLLQGTLVALLVARFYRNLGGLAAMATVTPN